MKPGYRVKDKTIHRDAIFQPEFREGMRHRVETDRRVALRVLELIEATLRDPFGGIGKPEPLKYLVQQPASLSPYRLSHGGNRGKDQIFFVSATVFI
jgi:hypothetical protein